MAKYIDADEFMVKIANIAKAFATSEKQQALMGRIMYCLEKQPAVDVREMEGIENGEKFVYHYNQ